MVGWCSWLSHLVNSDVNCNAEKVLGSSPSLIIHFLVLVSLYLTFRNEPWGEFCSCGGALVIIFAKC